MNQILKISATFSVPFPSTRRLQRRLHILRVAGLLRQWWYATEGPGGSRYYTLSPQSSRLLCGTELPPARAFSPVGISRQYHTRCLMEFLVHTIVGVHQQGFTFTDFARENTLALQVAGKTLYPDAAFTILAPGRPPLRFFVEIDTGSEPVTSPRERDSWQRKLTFYEMLRDICGYSFRVLGITKSAARLDNIIAAAAALTGKAQRPVFYGACLAEYFAAPEPIEHLCFRDARNQAVPLVPPPRPMWQEPGPAAIPTPVAQAQEVC